MAKKKQEEESPDTALVSAAKTIGSAAGKIASAVGVAAPTKTVKVPKLARKKKAPLPRREKKRSASRAHSKAKER
jgi:hypothetical protein